MSTEELYKDTVLDICKTKGTVKKNLQYKATNNTAELEQENMRVVQGT